MKRKMFYLKKEGVSAFLFVLLIMSLCSCTAKTLTPEVKNEFEIKAVYKFNDFVYNCRITKSAEAVIVTVLDTEAEGLVLKCDGNNVSFNNNSISKSFPVQTVDITNPAVILYEVFNSINSAEAEAAEENFVFTGNIRAGRFRLCISRTNELESLSVDSAGVFIEFIH